jgi:hypothetical protein
MVQRPHETLLADIENPLRQRRIRARFGEPLHSLPLKGNPDLQLGDFAVRSIEFGIPVAQPRTLSILMTTSDLSLADDSPRHASPRLSHVDNSARAGRTVQQRASCREQASTVRRRSRIMAVLRVENATQSDFARCPA